MLILLLLAIVAVSLVVRLISLPFRIGRQFMGRGYYGRPYGYGWGYRHHHRHHRHHGIGRLVLVILVLFALSHLFGHHQGI